MALQDIEYVRRRLQWMEEQHIWPNGLRYLWTDAFGLVLLLSLHQVTGDAGYRSQAERLVGEVYRVLGRHKGLRIGEAEDRDGQYFHYLAMWIYALHCFGRIDVAYRDEAIKLARDIHPAFVLPGRGVIWKMQEDLSAPYPGYGLGSMDAYDGYVAYKLLAPEELAGEIREMEQLIAATHASLVIDQDLGLGMMLWLCHFFPAERWAILQKDRSLRHLGHLWVEPPGYFCRQTGWHEMKFAFTNYGVALGLEAVGKWPQRVEALNAYFDAYRSGDEYDREAITHVMACTAHFPGLFLRGFDANGQGSA
jgi:hypothetical protein